MWADFLSHFAEISMQEIEQEKKILESENDARDGGSGGTGRIV